MRNPLDTSKQTRLKALLDLQTIIQRPDMPQDQLMLVKERVTELAVNMRAAPPAPTAAYAVSTPTPPVAVSQYQAPVPPVAVARPPSVTPGVGAAASGGGGVGGGGGGGGLTLDALLGQGALAALLSGAPKPATPVGNGYTPSATPQLQQAGLPRPGPAMAAIRSPPPQVPAVQPPPAAPSAGSFSLAGNPSALLAMLRQSGLITPTGAGTPPPASRTPMTGHTSLPGFAPPPVKAIIPPQFTMANLRQ